MTRAINRALRGAPLDTLWPLLALGVGLAGLLGTAHAAGELLHILECAGAVGGTDPGRQRRASGA